MKARFIHTKDSCPNPEKVFKTCVTCKYCRIMTESGCKCLYGLQGIRAGQSLEKYREQEEQSNNKEYEDEEY